MLWTVAAVLSILWVQSLVSSYVMARLVDAGPHPVEDQPLPGEPKDGWTLMP